MLWIDAGNWAIVALIVVVLAAAWAALALAAGRERPHRPAGAPGWWVLGVAIVVGAVAWIVLGLGTTAPEIDGRRVSGGITMTPEYFAALVALVAYTASHIAEIVRGSIQAVPRGQGEAADALALSGFQRTWHVVLPQAMRIAVPPIGNQYLNLAKNSSLAAVISFPELTKVTQLTVVQPLPRGAGVRAAPRHLSRPLTRHLVPREPRQPPARDRGALMATPDSSTIARRSTRLATRCPRCGRRGSGGPATTCSARGPTRW